MNGLPPHYDFVPPLNCGPNLEVPVILQLRSATMRGGHCTPRAREEKHGSSGDVSRGFLDLRYFRNVDFYGSNSNGRIDRFKSSASSAVSTCRGR